VIPALAVARELVNRHGAKVLFVGTARGLETRLVPGAGFALRLIDVGPLKSVSMMTRLRTLFRLPKSIGDCKRMIREFGPGAVLGVGGYASGPAMAAALFFGGGDGFLGVLPSWIWFLTKTSVLVFIFLWIRWTFPRLRVDRRNRLESGRQDAPRNRSGYQNVRLR